MTEERLDPKGTEMGICVMIDAMAKRYALLPSEVMSRASTFDLVIMDTAFSYENWLQNKDKPEYYNEEDLKSILATTK